MLKPLTVNIIKQTEERYRPMRKSENIIPIWEKYTLSIEEASVYFRIGENKLRELVKNNPDAKFILWNGNRAQIKRRLFEEYLDELSVV